MKLLLLLLALIALSESAHTQAATDTLRFATYSILDYGLIEAPERDGHLSTVLDVIRPHLLVTQDMHGLKGAGSLQENVMSSFDNMAIASFTDGPDTDNALFYDTTRIDVLEHGVIPTSGRFIAHWTIRNRRSNDTVVVFGVKLRGGDNSFDEQVRFDQATLLRERIKALPAGRYYLLAGDLETTSSSDRGYRVLTDTTGGGPVFHDPIDRPGAWHANPEFAAIHTQSPRVRAFDGGAGEGIDDRFDFILVSPGLHHSPSQGPDRAIPETYRAIGNDGEHLNDSINRLPNNAVSFKVANAIHIVSDHLPVTLDISFGQTPAAVNEQDELPLELNLSALPPRKPE